MVVTAAGDTTLGRMAVEASHRPVVVRIKADLDVSVANEESRAHPVKAHGTVMLELRAAMRQRLHADRKLKEVGSISSRFTTRSAERLTPPDRF